MDAKTIEERLASLEADRDRFLKALKSAAEMALKNPLVSATIPREMKESLKEYVKN